MKKLYILLFFFTAFFTNAQQMLNDYHVCDDGIDAHDGLAVFDLTTKNAEIIFISEAGDYDIQYFLTYSDAVSNTNAISTPTNYTNTWNPQQIFARATNIQTQQTNYFPFVLTVDSAPTANNASLTFCSSTELPIYNLNDAIPQLIGDQQGLTVEFYDTNTGLIEEPGFFIPTVLPVQTLAVLISGNCGTSEASLTLNTNNCASCPAPMGLIANPADTWVTLSWMPVGQISLYQVYLTIPGQPTPTPNTPPIALTQSTTSTISGLIPDTCYVFYVRSVCGAVPGTNASSTWTGPFNFCTHPNCENNGECPDNIALVAFIDANNNSVKDAGELAFDKGSYAYEINNSGATIYGYSNYNTIFHLFDSNAANAYNLHFAINADLSAYFSSSATYTNIHVTSGGGTQTYYFPITQLQAYHDLSVQIIPSGNPRPGFTYTIAIKIKNNGVANIPLGTVSFIKDDAVAIVSVVPSIPINVANGFTYDFTDLAVNEERTFYVTLQVPAIPTVSLGQVVTNTAYVDIISGEIDTFSSNNTAPLSQVIVGSYDPNDKTEAHGGKIALDAFTADDYMTYTIQFENTGSASAEFIRVEDMLDADLDADSVVMLNASHAYNMRRINKNLIWNFYNVNLPTTAANPLLSHGFIQFKVKPTAGYSAGTSIPNKADIYFDYNPVIVTNIFQTEFVATLSTPSFAADGFYIYPNPANTFIHIGLKESSETIAYITVRDILGKSVKVIDNAPSNETGIDISQLSKGLYFVEITTTSHLKTTKKLMID